MQWIGGVQPFSDSNCFSDFGADRVARLDPRTHVSEWFLRVEYIPARRSGSAGGTAEFLPAWSDGFLFNGASPSDPDVASIGSSSD